MMTCEVSILYLAGPYSHPSPSVRLRRFEHATEVAAELIRRGRIVFSPLTMTHPIDLVLANAGATLGSDYWLNFDVAFMQRCNEMAIIKSQGWRESSGVKREIEFFRAHGKPIWEIGKKFEILPYQEDEI